MKDFNIKMMPLKSIKPYDKNPRNNDEAVEHVANSIQEFGFKVPIVIDKDNVIVCGHTRYKACKQLGIDKVPCVIADDLNEEQIKAFRLADNKVSEKASWDWSLLNLELEEISFIDMEDFGFEFISDEEHEQHKEELHEQLFSILGAEKGLYDGNGYYDIPQIEPVYELPKIDEWIGFNYVLSDENPQGKAVHFFIDDYQFERLWKHPEKYVDKLKQYVCVASPDFSPFGDMPNACQIYNHYRKHWVAKYLQDNGVTVIPTIRASSDERSMDWYLDGEPKNSIVIISAMWTNNKTNKDYFINKEYKNMMEHLNPCKVFVYGGKKDLLNELSGNVERIETFTKERFGE